MTVNNHITNDDSSQSPEGHTSPIPTPAPTLPMFQSFFSESLWQAMMALQHFRFGVPGPDYFEGRPLEQYIDTLWAEYLNIEVSAIEAGLKK